MTAEDLFGILVREHADMLIAYLRSAVRDPTAADDLFQETMLVAWRRLDDYDKQRPFAPWLRGIAAKLVLAHHRKSVRTGATCDERTLEHLATRFDAVDRLPGDTFDEKLDALRTCVGALPSAYRRPIELHYGEEMNVASVAERMQEGLEAIKKRLQRARLRLLDCMTRKLGMVES